MKAGDGSIVAKARTVLRTVSVSPAARTPLPATSPISTTTWLSSTAKTSLKSPPTSSGS